MYLKNFQGSYHLNCRTRGSTVQLIQISSRRIHELKSLRYFVPKSVRVSYNVAYQQMEFLYRWANTDQAILLFAPRKTMHSTPSHVNKFVVSRKPSRGHESEILGVFALVCEKSALEVNFCYEISTNCQCSKHGIHFVGNFNFNAFYLLYRPPHVNPSDRENR